jgi:DNA gyrase/topoisomerase IV subunit A
MANKKQVLGRGLSAMLSSEKIDTNTSNINEVQVNEISVIGRNTQGVRLVGTGESNQVVSVEKLVE